MMTKNNLWVEKYRPTSLKNYTYQSQDIKRQAEAILESNTIPNLMLSGIQGTGKTTFAGCLVNDFSIEKTDILRINASRESGIDTIRERITNFCQAYPLGKFKVVILEEADGLSIPAQKALRSPIEDYSDTVRFIFTCNYPHKIIPALHSRCQQIDFTAFDEDALIDRAVAVLEAEQVEVDSIDTLLSHIKAYAPDLRKILVSLQQSSTNGSLGPVAALGGGNEAEEEWKLCWQSAPNLERLLSLASGCDNNNYDGLYRTMYENAGQLPADKRENAIIVIAEHLYKAGIVADQEINLVACLYKIFGDY